MSMVKTGIGSGKVKKITSDEELEDFEKKSEEIRGQMKKNAEKVKQDASRMN